VIRAALPVLALAFALSHLPFLVSTLEDIDSVNFALGVRDFDVADHRPHPPGYPAYIALGKTAVLLSAPFVEGTRAMLEARALSALALMGALAALILLYRVLTAVATAQSSIDLMSPPWRRLDPRALAATALAVSCPLFWYLSVRPMSDVPGLAAALAAQACLALAWWRQQPDGSGDRRLSPDRMAASGRMLVLGALLTGLAIGFRSQNAMLTIPFLMGVLFDRIGRGVAGALIGGGVAFAVGALIWAVPLVVASGGLDAYLAALGSQAGEDFAGVEMLYLNPSPRLAAFGLLRTLVYPWDSVLLGGTVVGLSAIGAFALLRRERRTLMAIILLALPYLVFHLLFHDTTFVRYALPLVPAVAFLAVTGLEAMARRAAVPLAAALALWAIVIGAPVLAAYASEPSPTVRAFGAIEEAALITRPGALAMHQTFRRPLEAEDVSIAPQLPSPPRREWLELAKYWREGHTAPLWFLADPTRTDLALIDPQSRADRLDFVWRWTSLSDLGGMRPRAVHWYRLPPPGWFAEEGWALTPETAGIARLMGRGPSIGPITAWIRRRPESVRVIVGGRHLDASAGVPVTFVAAVDGTDLEHWTTGPGFFLHEFELPAGTLAGHGLAALTLRSISGQRGRVETAIEQFDLQSSGTLMWGYDEGWHEAEFDPTLGLWRWTSDRATLRIVGATSPVVVTLRVESPLRYFNELPIVRMMAGSHVLGETRFDGSFVWRVVVPIDWLQQSGGRVAIESDRTFVPAERGEPADRRALGLRVFGVDVSAQH
jgi:multisubunit Na+/H+ antiporter MnhC subunit